MKKTSLIALILFSLFLLCSCEKKFPMDSFEKLSDNTSTSHAFISDDSSALAAYSKEALAALQKELHDEAVEYGYDKLFDFEKAMSRITPDNSVSQHKHSALDSSGNLTAEHLFEIVRENNEEYLATTVLLKDIDDALLNRICEILVETISDILEQYPDIDRERVYCNLGRLKIIQKNSALDYAAVEPEMVLHLNPTSANIVGVFSDGNMYSVIVHEAMHIIQFGCECEDNGECVRRFGLAYAYSDGQDYSDWTWLPEGSAERMLCLYSNIEPITYKTQVNYILSLDLATVLKKDLPANFVETISFYNDPDRLFSAFDAKDAAEKEEIYKMLYALEIMQMEPSDVKEAYNALYGTEWTEEIRDDVNNKLKRPIIKTITKQFYKNLADAVMNNPLTKNDVLFLVNLFESTINYHVQFDLPKYDSYNTELALWYADIQSAFFDSFTNISLEDYKNYTASDNDSKTINAGISWLSEEKRAFLLQKFEANLCDYKFTKNS